MFRSRVLLLSAAVLCGIGFTPSAKADLEFLKPANIENRVRKEIAKAEIGANLKIFSAEVFDGLGLAVKYRIESEPSYVNGFYTRIDKYSFNASVSPGDIIDDMDMPISFNIDKGAELIFARQFKSQKESLVALPYTPRNIPLSSDRALRMLNVGDFVGLEANLAFILSLNGSTLQGGFELNGSTHAFISGKFLVHLFRLPNDKMRVKLISLNRKGTGLHLGAEYGLDIVGFNFIEKQIDRIIDLSPLNIGVSRSNNKVFMLDYVIDLKDPTAAKAYDEMMTSKVQFQELKAANPLLSAEKMAEVVLTDLSNIESLASEDRSKQSQERRVHRLFKGLNQSSNTDQNFKIGFNLLKFENGTSWAKSKVTSFDRQNNPQKYILETHSNRAKSKGLFGLWSSDEIDSSSLLFLTDDKFNPTQFVAMSIDKSKKESELDSGDLNKIKKQVRALIPISEYNKIPWSAYDFKNGDYLNSSYRIQVFFHPEALSALPSLSTGEIKKRFEAYVKSTGGLNVRVANEGPWQDNHNYGPYRYDFDFEDIASNLHKITVAEATSTDRLEAFNRLKKIPAWEAKGDGFLISLLPASRLGQLISFEFSLTSKDGPVISHKFGKFEQEALYEALMYTQSVINNQGFDLRLWTDENGEYTIKSNAALK